MSWRLLFVGHVEIAMQDRDTTENWGKNSAQLFGCCSLVLNFLIGHSRTKGQALPGNQIRHWVPCWSWKWKLSNGLVLPHIPVHKLWTAFNSCCLFYSSGPQCGENPRCLHASCLPTWASPVTSTTSAMPTASFSLSSFLFVYFNGPILGLWAHRSLFLAWQKDTKSFQSCESRIRIR